MHLIQFCMNKIEHSVVYVYDRWRHSLYTNHDNDDYDDGNDDDLDNNNKQQQQQ